MTSQELKNSILQYAVQGKLVPQNPNDEPASELLKKIKAEKEKLIKDKVIKKEKPLLPITAEEKPFELPESWDWMKLGDLCDIINGFTPLRSKSEYWKNGTIPWFTVADIHLQGRTISKTSQSITTEALNLNSKRILPINTILLCCTASIGEFAITKIPLTTNQQFNGLVVKDKNILSPEYLFTITPTLKSKLLELAGKTTFNFVSVKKVESILIPLPPLAEQQRIVDKIEDLMPLVEEYGKAEVELKKLNKAFPEKIKKSVLQYAIQGKLVPQNPQNEQASVLLEKIKAEKQKLIREKKIKADKPLPAITEEEIPFEIPDNWVWVRLGDIGVIQTGTTPSTQNPEYFGNDIPFIKPADISFNGINYYNEGLTLLGSKKSRVIEKNSVLMVCIGGSIGKNFFNDRDVCCNQQINAITPLLASNKYLFYALCSECFYQSLLSKATGTATPIINKSTWSELIIPLPPLSEQKLIVEKVEEVLSCCDKLK